MSHAAWNAVTPYLSSRRRVIAFDIAGIRKNIRQYARSVSRRRLQDARDHGLWRLRLDRPEGFSEPQRAASTHQMGRKAQLGTRTDVGRSGRCFATYFRRDTVNLR